MNTARILLAIAGASLALSTARGVEPYELKSKSAFQADSEARAPFWPVGWVKPRRDGSGQPVQPQAEPVSRIQLQPQYFNITTVLLGNPPLATINGRAFGEGELLPVVAGKQRLRVLVRAIRDGGVWLEYETQQLFVPIRRSELGLKRTEQKAEPVEFAIKIPQ